MIDRLCAVNQPQFAISLNVYGIFNTTFCLGIAFGIFVLAFFCIVRLLLSELCIAKIVLLSYGVKEVIVENENIL